MRFACAWVEQVNAFNSVGAAVAPVVVGHFILTGSAKSLIPGGAVIPLLFGWAADKLGFSYAFIVPMLCYLYVSYYGISGCKPRRRVPP
ncbi:MAG: hypothetical protein ACRD25_05855 [Terracidiphilus sp.]